MSSLMSAHGMFETCRQTPEMQVLRGGPEVIGGSQNGAIDLSETFGC